MNLNIKHYGIILTCLLTAYFHLSLFPDFGFTLNGIGYICLLGAYFWPSDFFQQLHKMFWWELVIYTVVTIILWVIIGDPQFVAGTSSATGYYAKTAEVFLLVFLWADKPK